ncbi:MAG: oxidoreductase-like domain-containing protein [Pseudomonadota bacterium]|nr:oxidoreductase-like domain-containing protein [Pseudomonadota bacterium]
MNDKPIPPAEGECCENGCQPCVWESYHEALRQWQQRQSQTVKEIQDVEESHHSRRRAGNAGAAGQQGDSQGDATRCR